MSIICKHPACGHPILNHEISIYDINHIQYDCFDCGCQCHIALEGDHLSEYFKEEG